MLQERNNRRNFDLVLKKGTEVKTDIMPSKSNRYGGGQPTILAQPGVWEIIRETILENGYNSRLISENLNAQGIKVGEGVVRRWKKDNRRDFRMKIAIFERERALKQMLDKAMENQIEVLNITLEEGINDPRVLAIRQKATEQVLETLGSEYFVREKEKAPEDKAEQMIRMRLMLQRLIDPSAKVYDITATTDARLSEGDVQDSGGEPTDPDTRAMYDLRADLQKAVQ
jgi:hypothetical protein